MLSIVHGDGCVLFTDGSVDREKGLGGIGCFCAKHGDG